MWPMYMKRDQRIWKETYVYEKRPVYMNRYMNMGTLSSALSFENVHLTGCISPDSRHTYIISICADMSYNPHMIMCDMTHTSDVRDSCLTWFVVLKMCTWLVASPLTHITHISYLYVQICRITACCYVWHDSYQGRMYAHVWRDPYL